MGGTQGRLRGSNLPVRSVPFSVPYIRSVLFISPPGVPDSSPSFPVATSTPSVAAPSQMTTSNTSRTAAIAGGVVGGFLVLATVLVIALAIYRRNNPFAKDEPITKSRNEKIDVAAQAPNTPTPAYNNLLPMQFTVSQNNLNLFVSYRLLLSQLQYYRHCSLLPCMSDTEPCRPIDIHSSSYTVDIEIFRHV
jgi:hypothetical protein